jgi:hypothetical protein
MEITLDLLKAKECHIIHWFMKSKSILIPIAAYI